MQNRLFGLLLICAACSASLAQAQMTPEEEAKLLLGSGRLAFQDGEYPLAAQRFQDFITKFGSNPEIHSARFGWGLALLNTSPADEMKAAEVLTQVADKADFIDQPLANYYLGLAIRRQGHKALDQFALKPNEKPLQDQAKQHFTRAAGIFTTAVKMLEGRVKSPAGPDGKRPSEELDAMLRARCDLAEMQLQIGQAKEALATTEIFFKDPLAGASRFASLGNYYHGHAAYLLKDETTAAQALAKTVPFNDPAFGVHARYLLARVHHQARDREEAATLYTALIADYEQQVAAAKEAIINPAAFKKDPAELVRLDNLTKLPPPDYVARAGFFLGTLLAEQGKFAEAKECFAAYDAKFPQSPLAADAKVRLGVTLVQLRSFAEAQPLLQSQQDHPILAYQARWWLAKAQVGAVDPNNPDARKQAILTAIATLKGAADKAAALAATQPEAKERRSDIFMEQAELYQQLGQFNEAVNTFRTVLNEQPTPARSEEALQRLATAFQLAGNIPESENHCVQFLQKYPNSPLAAAVMFRTAENWFAQAEAVFKKLDTPNRDAEMIRLYGEAEKRYLALLDKSPEYPQIALAKFGQALCNYRLGKFAPAAKILAGIAAADRTEQLAPVGFIQADCLMRLAPESADDAITAGRLLQELGEAAKQLESFAAGNAKHELLPESLVKTGQCYARMASVVAEPQERNKLLQQARTVLEVVMNQHPQSPSRPVAILERANVIVLQGDVQGAINELNQFVNDPLKGSPVAPMALLRQATLYRSQAKFAEGEKVLVTARQQHEAGLVADPQRAVWAAVLQYHLGLTQLEQNKLAEAKATFDALAKQFADKLEGAEGAWRAGQCRRLEGLAKLTEAKKKLQQPGLSPGDLAAANTAVADAIKGLTETSVYFDSATAAVAAKHAGKLPHLQLLYEAAWTSRILGQEELLKARQSLQEEQRKKLQAEADQKAAPTGKPAPHVNAAEPPLNSVPLQPQEKKTRDLYQALIQVGADAPLAQVARFELAESHAIREEWDPAIALLVQVIDLEPAVELEEKARLRLGSCFLAKKEYDKSAAHFDALTTSTKPLLAAEARQRAAEVWIAAGNYENAVKQLTPLRDAEPLRNLPGVSDRGLLRLAFVLGRLQQWDTSRQACELLQQRFPQSVWLNEARYNQALALQAAGQHDQAVNTYRQVTTATAAEVGARAQLQIGVARLAQKKFPEALSELLIVPYTYDYPEPSAQALVEAAKAFVELKQSDRAIQLLKRVVNDYPQTASANQAKEQLAALQPK